MSYATSTRRLFYAHLFVIINAFFWGVEFIAWTDSPIPLLARQLWCGVFGILIPIVIETFVLIKKLEIASAVDSMERANAMLASAMKAVADVSRKLESGMPPRDVNPECWRN